ncbi:MAG TPA: hypothetical protein VLE44_00885 [Candidatus Saccharimonadales bacterium]|nr:hypothetical protein [Candidatus Saccharimonadales bacterium]
MSNENKSIGLERWLGCEHSIARVAKLSETNEDSGTPKEGYNSDYSCQNPEIVDRVETRVPGMVDEYLGPDKKVILRAVQLHTSGNTNEEGVKANLGLWCGKCPFFEPKGS